MSLCLSRLQEERKQWRKDHPFGFYAKPVKKEDGGLDLMEWKVGIPGKKKTKWEGGVFTLTMRFPPEYPAKPPKCQFPQGFYHPNIYPSGTVCLSIVNEGEDWRPGLTIKQILLGIQELLDSPNPESPAQHNAFQHFKHDLPLYDRNVIEQTKRFTP